MLPYRYLLTTLAVSDSRCNVGQVSGPTQPFPALPDCLGNENSRHGRMAHQHQEPTATALEATMLHSVLTHLRRGINLQ
jgi:hypothetical protein